MQQNERKGAWVVFILVLFFGFTIFGYGLWRRNEMRKSTVEQASHLNDMVTSGTTAADTNYKKSSSNSHNVKKGRRKKNTVKTKYDHDPKEKVRDILADTIPVR